MVSKFRFILVVLTIFVWVDLSYGDNINKINNIKDLLNENISLEDKVEYLNSIKNDDNYSFSSEDISILLVSFILNEDEKNIKLEEEEKIREEEESRDPFFLEDLEEVKSRYDKFTFKITYASKEKIKESIRNEEKIRIIRDKKLEKARKLEASEEVQTSRIMKDNIRISILEILIKPNVNENIITPEQIAIIVPEILSELDFYPYRSTQVQLRYLYLKALVKLNALGLKIHKLKGKKTLRTLFSDAASIIQKIELDKNFYKKNSWFSRKNTELFIFNPVLLKDYGDYGWKEEGKNFYIKEDKKVLKDYETYLLDHIRFFPITENLKALVEAAFYKTQFIEFRSKYIENMFYLEMGSVLAKIALDSSIDIDLRKQAIYKGVNLLYKKDHRYLKIIGTSFLKALENIAYSLNEVEELRNLAQDNLFYIRAILGKEDDIKNVAQIFWDPSLSTKQKIKYFKNMVDIGFSFKDEDIDFIMYILNDRNLGIELKVEVANIAFWNGKNLKDIFNALTEAEKRTVVFLRVFAAFLRYHYNSKEVDKILMEEINLNISSLEDESRDFIIDTLEMYIEQSYKLDLWKILLCFVEGKIIKVNKGLRKIAMRACVYLLYGTNDFKNFSKAFLRSLKKISSNEKEVKEIKKISDYILKKVDQSNTSYLKEAYKDCVLKMMI